MDFKVAGTSDTGITALQMDIKIEGITRKEIMDKLLLVQAQGARLAHPKL